MIDSPTVRKLLIVSLAINLLGVAAFTVRRLRSPRPEVFTSSLLYKSRVDSFNALPIKEGAVVFAGDSVTEFCRPDEGIQNAINRGLSGDTVRGLAERAGEINRHSPRAVFVMVGTNDLLQGRAGEDIVSDYGRLLDALKSRVVVQGVPPLADADANRRVAELNAGLRALAEGRGLQFLDTAHVTPGPDGTHPAGEGCAAWRIELLHLLSQGNST